MKKFCSHIHITAQSLTFVSLHMLWTFDKKKSPLPLTQLEPHIIHPLVQSLKLCYPST